MQAMFRAVRQLIKHGQCRLLPVGQGMPLLCRPRDMLAQIDAADPVSEFREYRHPVIGDFRLTRRLFPAPVIGKTPVEFSQQFRRLLFHRIMHRQCIGQA